MLALTLLAGCVAAPTPAARAVASTVPPPTPRPAVDLAARPINTSNLPGADDEPAIAAHPTENWVALAWVNRPPGQEAGAALVYVQVQEATTGAWQPPISVNTAPAAQHASRPDLTIDAAGVIHVVFGQRAGGTRFAPHYTRSADGGATWSPPERLRTPADATPDTLAARVAVDPAGAIHIVLLGYLDCFDCFRAFHQTRRADAPAGTAWVLHANIVPGDKQLRVALAFTPRGAGWRTVVAVACAAGCGQARAVVATWDGPGTAWQTRRIGGHAERAGWSPNWVSLTAIPGGACVAWGYYSRSGNYSSCSFDGGDRWEDAKPIIETPESEGDVDQGLTPELLYEPSTNSLLAVWAYRQPGESSGRPKTVYLAYSYRRLHEDHWVPDMSGPFRRHQSPLRLLEATPRNLMVGGPRLAYNGGTYAYVAWSELERGGSQEAYVALFNPAGLLSSSWAPRAPGTARP